MLAWFRLVRVTKKMFRHMDEPIQSLHLSRAQFDLLMQIAFDSGINQKTCAKRMDVTKGNVTLHLKRLEKAGLVKRSKVGRDKYLELSEHGEQAVAEFLPGHDSRVREIFSVLSDEDIHNLQDILRKLDRSLA